MEEKIKPILLSFSSKNKDVALMINDRNTEEFKQNTDYICNSIRFYEKYKDIIKNSNNVVENATVSENDIEEIMLKLFKKYNVPMQSESNNLIVIDKNNIEDNLDNVSDEED